jgi:MFS family permease
MEPGPDSRPPLDCPPGSPRPGDPERLCLPVGKGNAFPEGPAEGPHSRNILLISFFLNAAIGLVWVGIAFLGIELGADALELGVIGSAAPLTYVVSTTLFGQISRRFDTRPFLWFPLLVYAACLLAMPRSSQWWHMLPLIVISVSGMGMFWPAFMALAAELGPAKHLAKQLSAYNFSWCAGIGAGNALAGVLSQADPRLPLYAGAAIYVISAAVLGSRVKEYVALASGWQLMEEHDRGRSSQAVTLLALAWIGAFAVAFSVGMVRMLFPLLGVHMHLGKSQVGFLLGAISAAQAAGFLALGAWEGWQWTVAPLAALEILACAGMVLAWRGRVSLDFAVAFSFLGLAGAVTYTTGYFYGVYGQAHKTVRTGLHEAINSGAGLLGPLLGGVVANAYGLSTPYLMAAALLACALLLQLSIQAALRRSSLRLRSGQAGSP